MKLVTSADLAESFGSYTGKKCFASALAWAKISAEARLSAEEEVARLWKELTKLSLFQRRVFRWDGPCFCDFSVVSFGLLLLSSKLAF